MKLISIAFRIRSQQILQENSIRKWDFFRLDMSLFFVIFHCRIRVHNIERKKDLLFCVVRCVVVGRTETLYIIHLLISGFGRCRGKQRNRP